MPSQGFGPWTIKDGMTHVAPPFPLLAEMVTLRIHLDPVPENNAPLLIVRGSHHRGLIAETAVAGVVEEREIAICLASVGDIWCYATPILHASEASTYTGRRRVLQVDYSTSHLPDGLEWLGL